MDEFVVQDLSADEREGVNAASAVLVCTESTEPTIELRRLAQELAATNHTIFISHRVIEPAQLELSVDKLVELLRKSFKVKHFSIIAYGNSASFATVFAINHPRVVRRLIIINPRLAVRETIATKLLGLLERLVPQGLPTTAAPDKGDIRWKLHRVRVPTLVVVSDGNFANGSEAERLQRRIPNSWLRTGYSFNSVAQDGMLALVSDFLTISVKNSQKRLLAVNE